MIKQGQKRPLDTPERKIERRERERETERERERERDRETEREREREGETVMMETQKNMIERERKRRFLL